MNTRCPTIANQIRENGLKLETEAKRPGQIFRRILVGTDFSAASIPAFDQALLIARQNKAELLITHVYTMPHCISFMPPESYGQWAEKCRTEAAEQIGAMVREARKAQVKAHMLMLSGFADDAMVDAARHLGVDLIVIGTHGRRGISRFITGSIAARVVARAPCSVLTVHLTRQTREVSRRH